VGGRRAARTSTAELIAFEVATRDLVGLALRSVEQLEVTLSQFRLLLVLDELGRSSSTRCAQALGVVGSSVTRLADRLHASGHLVRGADPDNRSIVTLELTDAGRRVVRQVQDRRRRELRRALDGLDPAARAVCTAALEELHHALGGAESDEPHHGLPL
jgi:DNA-binding MarR family transcriptional regulator